MPPEKNPKTGKLLLGIPLIAAGLALFVYTHYQTDKLSDAAHGWRRVRCRVDKAEVVAHKGPRNSVTYNVAVRYRYDFEGREYEGNRTSVSNVHINFTGRQEAQRHAEYLRDRGLCWVNPARPEESAVEMSSDGAGDPHSLVMLFALSLAGVGVYLIHQHFHAPPSTGSRA